jgi:hypothetical protein
LKETSNSAISPHINIILYQPTPIDQKPSTHNLLHVVRYTNTRTRYTFSHSHSCSHSHSDSHFSAFTENFFFRSIVHG